MKTTSSTLPKRNVKKKAPQPPKLVIPKFQQTNSVPNGHHTIGGKKITKKRRAPSPPNVTIPETPTNDGIISANQNDLKDTTPPSPTSINTQVSVTLSETEREVNQISQAREHKSLFPVFVAPPPPDSTPPPIDECETPVGPIDSELGKLKYHIYKSRLSLPKVYTKYIVGGLQSVMKTNALFTYWILVSLKISCPVGIFISISVHYIAK